MAEFERPEVPVCPWWKKYAIHQDDDSYKILALCGREQGEKPNIEEADIGVRVKKCPWIKRGATQAYYSPVIVEISGFFDEYFDRYNQVPDDYDVKCITEYRGLAGVEDLSYSWPSQLARFQEDY